MQKIGTAASPRRAGEQRGRQDSNLRWETPMVLVHRLNHAAATTGTRVSSALFSRQGSNLRGETPMDFESIALTSRPQLRLRAGSSSLGCRRAAQGATGVRHKIQLKDEVGKGARRPVARRQKAAVTRIAAAWHEY
ncbi:hypothetical protein G5714_020142 [Onychostoma macrolepis]|uniref:Uncharacterized protein n=1 Tax=Onychostoma macrolepis TaxID=369639 RepID=A0A7J6BYF8_9TELE|nr:hypothetical protein G5714_020142 [Onychostoma macrolepis]